MMSLMPTGRPNSAPSGSPSGMRIVGVVGLRQQIATVEVLPGLDLRLDFVDAGQQRLHIVGHRQLAGHHARARVDGAQAGMVEGSMLIVQRLYRTPGSQ